MKKILFILLMFSVSGLISAEWASYQNTASLVPNPKLPGTTTGGQTDSCGSPRWICNTTVVAVTNNSDRAMKIWNKLDPLAVTFATTLEAGATIHFDSKGYCCDNIVYTCEKTNDADEGKSTCKATFSLTALSGGGKPDRFGCRTKDFCGTGSAL